jgi:hypothetical protein
MCMFNSGTIPSIKIYDVFLVRSQKKEYGSNSLRKSQNNSNGYFNYALTFSVEQCWPSLYNVKTLHQQSGASILSQREGLASNRQLVAH